MSLYLTAFLILPLVSLVAKESGELKLPLWLIFFIYLGVGWLLVHLSVQSSLANIDGLVRNTPHPSSELLDEWQSDGARQVFALYFGWAYAAIYFLACLLVVKIICALRRK